MEEKGKGRKEGLGKKGEGEEAKKREKKFADEARIGGVRSKGGSRPKKSK